MEVFSDRLFKAIEAKRSAVCVGLDPRLAQIPAFIKDKHLAQYQDKFKAAAECLIEFNKGIIDAVFDLVPIVKPQLAFFEQFGAEGLRAFAETVAYAKSKGLLVLADAKRGDIGSTSEAYSSAFLGRVDLFDEQKECFGVDAITLNPYMGFDAIKPFLLDAQKYAKGLFILVKTSNLSSGDLQDCLTVDNISVYEHIARLTDSWGADDIGEHGFSAVGVVVGAQHVSQARKLRQLLPKQYFLVPGYGAQGGTALDVRASFNEDGSGAIVNSSRGIIFAYEQDKRFAEEDYALAAREAVITMNRAIQSGF